MNLLTSIETTIDKEKFVLLMNLGILNALRNKLISVDEAERFLYTPGSVNIFKQIGVRDEIADFIYLGCELEDIESLLPEIFVEEIDKLIEQTESYLDELPDTGTHGEKWIVIPELNE